VLFLAAGVSRAELVERVVASVNNDVIALSDLRRAVAFNQAVGGKGTGRKAAAQALDGLINRSLLLQEAARLRFVEVTDREIAEEVARLRSRLGSEQAFADLLARTGMDEGRLGRMFGERLLVERFVERKIGLYARVSRDDAEAYFREHAAEFAGRRFADVQAEITALLADQMVDQQLDLYLADLRGRADLRINPLTEQDGF
jgi:hypothetical protein